MSRAKTPYTKNKVYLSMAAHFLRERTKTLDDCYNAPSQHKRAIYADCIREAIKNNACFYGVISYNTYAFTFGYTSRENNEWVITIILPTKTKKCLYREVEQWLTEQD